MLINTSAHLVLWCNGTGSCFMYLFMGVLWGHFSSSNSPGILAQELDIHICVNEISFQGLFAFTSHFYDSRMTLETTWLSQLRSIFFPSHMTFLFFLCNCITFLCTSLPGAHGSTSSSRSVATFAFFRVDQISVSHRQRIEP